MNELYKKLKNQKKPVALRIPERLLEKVDKILPETTFESRTDFIEEAIVMYLEYVDNKLHGIG